MQEALALADGDVLHIKKAGWGVFNLDADDNAVAVPRVLEKLQGKLESIMKGKYDHFMQKEIFEQPDSIHATMLGRVKRVQRHSQLACRCDVSLYHDIILIRDV